MIKDTHAQSKEGQLNKIAVFGFKDALVGQVIQLMQQSTNYHIECFISVNDLPNLDVVAEHAKRPNKKTEFIENNRIFGKPVYVGENYLEILQKDGIEKVLILEDDKEIRSRIFASIKKTDIEIVSFMHPTVFFGGFNTLGEGVIIFPNCSIGYKSDIGNGAILQSNCVIGHHNTIGSFTDINPNVTTGGFTKIGDFVEINLSVDIINRIDIGNGARIGAGSLVLKNCAAHTLYYGRPAKAIRKLDDTDRSGWL